ncbi:MAG: serine protease Do [Paraglaciecola sp.]|jgi:serine protease Do
MESLILKNILFLLSLFSVFALSQQTAQNLFSQHQKALYQIRIIELSSGNKSSIGSGFQIDEDGAMVTNYHVVSEYLFYPEKYRIEFLAVDGQKGDLQLLDFDVVNDLALVKKTTENEQPPAFSLAQSLPLQGSTIYSLGNPHDLGMIVVPGTFNGLKKNSFYQRIHFTGAINPGMSGGPVVNPQGEVVGVNVATAGNQIGFLIPLEKLQALAASSDKAPVLVSDYKHKIRQQLIDNQDRLFSYINEQEWEVNPLGKARVPTKVTDFMSCWGDSNSSNEDTIFLSVENRCRLDEQIYLHKGFATGRLELEFEWLDGEELGQHRFYALYSDSISGAGAGNSVTKTDVTNFKCQKNKVTNINDVTSKTVLCLRAYKDFASLYDVLFIGATLDHAKQGLISHFTLAGVTQDSALSFTKQFMDSISWQ